ncbi:hypothetical protein RRG08_026361 [Elysia crispata]|uniref:Uncharacterized protein n=1 Tax=Elysia crispata TaxID=231223 RepID=A0AAE0XNC1_9GAST|nr:hypothetical protein RRG08_026361 [Elysia crispata]
MSFRALDWLFSVRITCVIHESGENGWLHKANILPHIGKRCLDSHVILDLVSLVLTDVRCREVVCSVVYATLVSDCPLPEAVNTGLERIPPLASLVSCSHGCPV